MSLEQAVNSGMTADEIYADDYIMGRKEHHDWLIAQTWLS